MTNNPDDFEDLEPTEAAPQPRPGFKENISRAWSSQPLFKLLAIMTVAAAVIGVSLSLFGGGGKKSEDVAKLSSPPSLNQPAGGQASPYFIQQTKEAEAQRAKEALQSGGSALPTPIGQNSGLDELGNDRNKKDPLVELRAETERMKQELQQQQRQMIQQQSQQPAQQFDETLSQAMQRQMAQLTESWAPKGIKQVAVVKEEVLKKDQNAAFNIGNDVNATAAGGLTPVGSDRLVPLAKILVPAGTVNYAQLLVEANSDVQGPILAQILSGPLNGARAVGKFEVMEDYLVMHFTLVSFKGKDYTIDALALDPDTTLGGMATDVDHRYFSRVILPAAAGFMQGLGSALSQGSSSATTNGSATVVQQSGKGIEQGTFQGLAQAGQTLSQFFQNQANQIKPLVRVAAGTPVGLFFTTSVHEPSEYSTMESGARGMPQIPGLGGYGVPGAGGYGGMPGGYGAMPGAGYASGYYPGAANTGSAATSNVPYPNYGTAGMASPYGQSGINSPYLNNSIITNR